MKACKLKFYEEKVMEKMDSNTNLIGFDNCIYDLMIRERMREMVLDALIYPLNFLLYTALWKFEGNRYLY